MICIPSMNPWPFLQKCLLLHYAHWLLDKMKKKAIKPICGTEWIQQIFFQIYFLCVVLNDGNMSTVKKGQNVIWWYSEALLTQQSNLPSSLIHLSSFFFAKSSTHNTKQHMLSPCLTLCKVFFSLKFSFLRQSNWWTRPKRSILASSL